MVYPEIRIHRTVVQTEEIARFTVVGAIGFAVNFSLLWLLHGRLGMGLLPAQLVAGEVALLATFILHNNWTYRNYFAESLLKRAAAFHVSAWLGVGLNLVILLSLSYIAHVYYLLSLAIGAGIVMIWNFVLNRLVIWREKVA